MKMIASVPSLRTSLSLVIARRKSQTHQKPWLGNALWVFPAKTLACFLLLPCCLQRAKEEEALSDVTNAI